MPKRLQSSQPDDSHNASGGKLLIEMSVAEAANCSRAAEQAERAA